MDIWEESLIGEMKQGKHCAFERCYRLLSPQIYTVIYKICLNHATAQDLLQDTFLDIFEKVHLYRKQHSFIAWSKRIAFNNTLNFIKRNKRIVLMGHSSDEGGLIDFEPHKMIQDSALLDALLVKINEAERLVLWLFIVEQYSHDEIAVLVDKTPSYSKSIVSRALKKLRTMPEVRNHAYCE
ncbi:RNA polymerase sigma factor [Thalassotalea sediminis]|uniref:RNA polymerase sigma factor n=1 Tax=Thalassotalea sediminis TaxID=1759089 RepID=UPI002574768A|nr:sigma-70 family RNA polymerase sigma factor [Thalassotalea sediminis]